MKLDVLLAGLLACAAPAALAQVMSGSTPNPACTNLQLWLRADAGVAGGGNGTAVTAWTNRCTSANAVGNAVNSVMTSGGGGLSAPGTGPTLVASAINGLPALQFNGTNEGLDILNSAALLANDSYTLFIVVQDYGTWPWPQPGQVETILGNNYNTFYLDGGGGSTWNGSQYQNSFQVQSSDNWTTIGSTWGLADNTVLLGACATGSAGGQTKLFVDGAENDNAAAMNAFGGLGSDWSLGWQWDCTASSWGYGASGRWYYGLIAEILVYQGHLLASDMTNVNNYLGAKYGINLPPPQASTPAFNPPAGLYAGQQSITISADAGSTIFYTTDGSNPTNSPTRHSGPSPVVASVPAATNLALEAYATNTGYTASAVASAAYTTITGPIYFNCGGLGGSNEIDLAETLQGLVNRTGPHLMFGNNLFYADDYIQDYTWNAEWETIYEQEYGLTFQNISDLSDLLWCFRNSYNGLIAYDPAVDGSRCVAVTMAGIYSLLPVPDPEDYAFLGVPLVYDLRGQFTNSVAAYAWALTNVMPYCNRNYAHALGGAGAPNGYVDTAYVGWGWEMYDYTVMNTGFVFNLTFEYTNVISWDNRTINGDTNQANMYRTILATLAPQALINGYGEAEGDFFGVLSQYGCHYLYWGDNWSFHAKVPAHNPELQQPFQYTTNNVTLESNKYYVCFITSEGDTGKGVQPFFNGSWSDPARGTVPMNWAIPHVMGRFPAMLEYYYDTATADDYFVGMEAMAFIMTNVTGFAQTFKEEMAAANLTVIDGDNGSISIPANKQTFFDTLQPLGGYELVDATGAELQGWLDFYPDGTPLAGAGYYMTYWNRLLPGGWNADWAAMYETNSAEVLGALTNEIYSIASQQSPPFIIIVYTDLVDDCDYLCRFHADVAAHLGPQFKAARLDEALAAVRDWNRPLTPAVAMNHPTNSETFVAPANVPLSANVTVNGHTINAVNYYSNSVAVVGRSTNGSAYAANWGGVPAGNYSLTAVAKYDGSLSLTSAPVIIQVLGTPVITGYKMLSNGQFQLTFAGIQGQPFQVLRTNVLSAPPATWPVLTNGVFGLGGSATVTDARATGTNQHWFYRIVSP
jgi:hypothetical protein